MLEHIKNSNIKPEHDTSTEVLERAKLIHDLRNCLAPVLMQAQLLSKYAENAGSEAEAIKASAQTIERSVKEMVGLLNKK